MLFYILNNREEKTYFSGSAFLKVVRNFDWTIPSYTAYIEQRRNDNKSTTRRDYYKDILDKFDELTRIQIYKKFIDKIKDRNPKFDKVSLLEEYINGFSDLDVKVPKPEIKSDVWSSERLYENLKKIDQAIIDNNYKYAVTLSYTCLEGFYKAFIRENIPTKSDMDDLTKMAKEIRDYINKHLESKDSQYPEQIIILISTITYAIGNSRNKFSDSHFDSNAEIWLAEFCRDCVNSVVRLILKFM